MIEPGVLAPVPVVGRSREWCAVSEKYACPCCGYLLGIPEPAADTATPAVAVRAVIESMDREIRQLRETVAMLRGARAR
jgi:hypothetical protein